MSRILLIVHGIRTNKKRAQAWMHPLRDKIMAAAPDIQAAYLFEYGFLGVLGFRAPLIGGHNRKHFVRRFQRFVAWARKRHPDAAVEVVGHSFGTYLIGHSMTDEGGPRAFYDRVVLMGCILSSRDDWTDKAGHYTRVLNLWSGKDRVVEFDTLGQSGWRGFIQAPPAVQSLEMPGYSHTDYCAPGTAWEALTGFLAGA